jgi:hypothetical protein
MTSTDKGYTEFKHVAGNGTETITIRLEGSTGYTHPELATAFSKFLRAIGYYVPLVEASDWDTLVDDLKKEAGEL